MLFFFQKKGHSWKKLSPNEREKWEAEAVAAQAQHRAMYPDWRFRPGANALAKLKIKDGGTTTRRRSARVKDPPDEESASASAGGVAAADDDDQQPVDADQGEKRRGKEKGRNKSNARMLSLRCAKIADFVADGIRGEELEVAVKQWEGDRKMGKEKLQRPRLSRTRGASSASTHARSHSYTTSTMDSSSMSYHNDSSPSRSNHIQNSHHLIVDPPKPAGLDNHNSLSSGVPLTHMFKRSLSAPVSHTDQQPSGPISPSERSDDSSAGDISPYTTAEPRSGSWDNYSPLIMQMSPTGTHAHERRDSISFPMPSGTNTATTSFDATQQHLTWQDAENQRRIEEMQEPNSWWGDSRSSEVEPFGYHSHRTSGITEMGYESCGATHFDAGYVEVGISPFTFPPFNFIPNLFFF